MYVYFDQNGTLKEIVSDKKFRVGDSKRDKIYVYWEGEHTPISGWVKYRKPDGTEYPFSVEECFYQLGDNLVGKALPNKPLRNLKYFSYDHTYEENGETHVGYKFYEIVVPDAVLNVSNDDEKEPTQNNMIVARVRFVMDDGITEGEVDEADSIETLGSIVFAVETNIGILTDSSIDESQYNYLLRLLSTKLGLGIKSLKVDTLPESGVADTIYYVKHNDGVIYDAYFWNGTQFVFLGTTSYDLYTKQEGEDFEVAIQALWTAELEDYKTLMNHDFETFKIIVNNQLSILDTKVNNMASGTPKGTFATVTALQNAYPAGTTGVYIVRSNGHWYYWNGSVWTDGGEYLSTGDAVPATRKIVGLTLENDIGKETFVNALCDDILDDASSNPLKNNSICRALGGTPKYFKTGSFSSNEAPASDYPNTICACGMAFNKADLKGKDISMIKTRVCFSNPSATFPRTIAIKVYSTNIEHAADNVGSITFDAPFKTIQMNIPSNNYDISPVISLRNSEILTDVFAIIFYDISATGASPSGLYLAKSTRDGDLYNKNGGFYTNVGNPSSDNYKSTGNDYSNYCNYYIELKYIDLGVASKSDLDNYIPKDEVGYQKQENRNIWNITEQVESSWANPNYGNIENYPEDNQYIQNYIRSGYLKVSPNTQYILSAYGDTSRRGRVFVCYYNENKTFISGGEVNAQSSSAMIINGTTFTTPNNASIKYMIMSISVIATKPYQLEEGNVATPYQVYTGDKYEMGNLIINSGQIVDVDTPASYINLPNELYAVVGDTFEMFYKGILNLKSFEGMYVECVCDIGYSYQRKFKCTPATANIGNHNLTIKVYNNNKILIDSKTIVLKVVAKATSPSSNKNILCMGDSLTAGGTWVAELHRRINLSNSVAPNGDEAPTGLGLSNITFIGKKITSNGAGYEGFGGWRFSNYLDPSTSTEDYWITSTTHNKTDADQESIWQDTNGVKWQLETIETNRLKFKKHNGSGVMPLSGTLTWVSGGTHTENIVYANATLAEGNPFAYNGQIDFGAYCEDLGISTIDEVYILLGWNNYATASSTYKAQAKQFIDLLRAFNPSIKVVLMGLEVPSADGIAQNYGADASLTYLRQQKYVFDLNNLYQEIAGEYDSGVSFMNIASQFDTDYCMPTIDTTPNTRVFTQIKQQSNGVHPAASGYYQIADVVYRWICAKIN